MFPPQAGHYEDTFRGVGDDWLLVRLVAFLPLGSETERLPPPAGDPGR